MNADAAGEFGKHFARHTTASGQDLAQSGRTGFSRGQQGMPSAPVAMSDISDADASSIAAAPDDAIIGEVTRLTIARIESMRGMNDRIRTSSSSHMCATGKRTCTTLEPSRAEPARSVMLAIKALVPIALSNDNSIEEKIKLPMRLRHGRGAKIAPDHVLCR